jgi:predicted helicase
MFVDTKLPDDILAQTLSVKDGSSWKIEKARKKLREENDWRQFIASIQYRPFDTQWIYYHDAIIERSRWEVMQHMLQNNLGLCIGRAGQVVGDEQLWNLVWVSGQIIDFNLFYRGGELLFPLYLHTEDKSNKKPKSGTTLYLFEDKTEYQGKRPNLNEDFFNKLKEQYGKAVTPEDIFHYIYAVLYAPEYRKKYAEFLKTDFPRIPFTADKKLFFALAKLGEELVALHLLKSPTLDTPTVTCPQKGDNLVAKPEYDAKQKRVYFNDTQYFAPVPPAVWEYQIGGYQVCAKWLKDRKGRALSAEDMRHYCRFATAIEKTIEIQKEIDELYQGVEKDLLNVQIEKM